MVALLMPKYKGEEKDECFRSCRKEKELGTCFLGVSIRFADVVRRHTGIPESDQMVMGMAIGYPDADAPINGFRSDREPLEAIVRWVH